MAFDEIDGVIDFWAGTHTLVLFRENSSRFCYTSSDCGECFQFVVRPPIDRQMMVEIFSIETVGAEDLHKARIVPVDKLLDALEEAWATVQRWMLEPAGSRK